MRSYRFLVEVNFKSVCWNKDQNHCYYNIFLEKCSYQIPKTNYDRICVFGGIGVNKTSESKERDIFHYWYFLDKGFKFQPDARIGCLNLAINNVYET